MRVNKNKVHSKYSSVILHDYKNISYFGLNISFLCWIVMLVFFENSNSSFPYKLRSVMACGGAVFYVISSSLSSRVLTIEEIKQIFIIDFTFFICTIIVFIDLIYSHDNSGISDYIARGSFVLGFGIAFVIFFLELFKQKIDRINSLGNRISKIIKSHSSLVMLVALVIIYLLTTYNSIIPMWDGALLYKYSSTLSGYSLFSLSSLSAFGHISYSYVAISAVLRCLFEVDNVQFIFFSLAFIISICCFYGIVKLSVPNKKDITYTFSTIVYAFSPFTLGMIHDPYLDLYSIFIFTILIYCYFSGKIYFATTIAVVFLFIKEPSIIELCAFILGLLACEMYENREKSIVSRFLIIIKKKYTIMLFFVAVWLCCFLFICHWENSDSTIWTFDYAIKQCKVIFGINFNWLLFIISLAFLVISLLIHNVCLRYLVPLSFSFFAMFCFLVLYPTHNHPRYLGAIIVPLYIITCIAICSISSFTLKTVFQLVIALLIILSSFMTIDPISRMLFKNISVGSDCMITTGDDLSDSIVYNSQYEGYQKVLNKVIYEILKDNPNAIICMPAVKGNTWYYDALGNWKEVDSSIVVEEYYDLNSGIRYSEYREGTIDLELTFVTSYADFNGIASQGETHLLYLPFVGTEESDEINKKCSIEREDEYSLNGWTLHDLVFR